MATMTRKNFLKGAGALGAASIAAGTGVAMADEAPAAPVVLTAENVDDVKWAFEIMPEEWPVAEDLITTEYTNDIVVVGAGLSGLCTAVSAKEMGADVRVFTASSIPMGRGGSNHALGTKVQKAMGIDYTPDTPEGRHAAKVEKLSASFFIDERKWSDWLGHSAEAMDWMIDKMESKGMYVDLESNYTDPDGIMTVPRGAHNFYASSGIGGAILGAPICASNYAEIFTEMGGEIEYNMRGLYLIREDNNTGRVSAIVAQNMETGEYVRYNANKAIVLATGDFSRDADMMAKYSPWVWKLFKNCLRTDEYDYDAGLTYNGLYHGDGHKMGLWIGAGWQKTPTCAPMVNCAAQGPSLGAENFSGINLSSDGKRYHNECVNFAYGAIAILQRPDHIAYSVWDADYSKLHDVWNGFMGSLTSDEQLQAWINSGQYIMADTIEELLDKLGFEGEAKENAIKSIEDYSRYADQGVDEEYHVAPEVLRPIRTPPFFGARTTFNFSACTFLTICGGLRTNEYLQVCEDDDTPIDGLFNTGIMIGDYYAGCYNFVMPGMNLGGVCNCLSYLLGRRLADPDFKFASGKPIRKSTVEDESVDNDGAMLLAMFSGM